MSHYIGCFAGMHLSSFYGGKDRGTCYQIENEHGASVDLTVAQARALIGELGGPGALPGGPPFEALVRRFDRTMVDPDDGESITQVADVPGGFVVRSMVGEAVAMVFVPKAPARSFVDMVRWVRNGIDWEHPDGPGARGAELVDELAALLAAWKRTENGGA